MTPESKFTVNWDGQKKYKTNYIKWDKELQKGTTDKELPVLQVVQKMLK